MSREAGAPETSLELARFLSASRYEDLPAALRHEAKRSLLNFFAVAFAGSREIAVETALGLLQEFAGPPQAAIVGRPERTDLATAAFLNCASANVYDFDDTHPRTVIHPTAPAAAPLLALSHRQRVSGPALLHAFVLGAETECRIGNAVSPGHYRRGWHITATCGVFGAAAASGKLLGLDAQGLLWALGNASAQSSGLVETLGFMAKSLGVGNAARNGLLSALLAERGFDGPARPLEGPRGFLQVMGEAADPSEITGALGERWELLDNTYKPYPCGVVLNSVIDGCLALQARGDCPPEAVESVTLHGHPLLRQRTDRPDVATGREAQVSAHHAVAVCLLFGAAGLAQFSDAAVRDPRVLALRRTVSIVDDAEIPVEGIRIELKRRDGTRETLVVEQARGSAGRPLADSELEDKLRRLAADGAPGCRPEPLIEAVWGLEDLADASELLRLAVPS
ncbi:MAG: MmgE/PrpD family protein [Tistlia sp.]|uniref:MmgE/PrpD family protein n=1 Tax=Tistlia sp. TaxID=3057121 RepID=UPI0034A557A3